MDNVGNSKKILKRFAWGVQAGGRRRSGSM